MLRLYIYDHCPFSMRPRLLAGLKQLPVEIVVVPFADMETQVALVGKKIAPILQNHDGSCLTESLKITQYLDDIGVNMLSDEPLCTDLESYIQGFQKEYMSLTAPKFILSMREFQNQADRERYQKREEGFIGKSFSEILVEEEETKINVETYLENFEPFIVSDDPLKALTLNELVLFPYIHHLKIQVDLELPVKCQQFWDTVVDYIPH